MTLLKNLNNVPFKRYTSTMMSVLVNGDKRKV